MTRAGHPLRVTPLPAPVGDAPYLRLLHGALERQGGVQTVELPDAPAALREPALDVVHLHWLEYLIRPEQGGVTGWARARLRAMRLRRALALLRRRGTAIVWTVHNLRPHEPRYPRLEAALARFAIRRADRVIVHSSFAAERVAELYGGQPDVIPHGHFIDAYRPPARSRREVRAELGLPDDAFAYLVFGQIRPYKRIPAALEAFGRLPYPDARLVVAGVVADDALEREIAAAAGGDDRILLRFGHVPDDRVAELHLAADAVVIPYAQVFSSGALLLALSMGLPVVAPAAGTSELASPPAVEVFADGGLAAAMASVRRGDPAARRKAARLAAERFSWEGIAARTRAVYEGAVR